MKAVQNRNGLRTHSHSRIPLAIASLPVYEWESQQLFDFKVKVK
ncbi:hypothetical protein [Ornithinibacillus gellani]|nr:hypothetical protein [Ornithinibacillus gellani]